MIEGNAFYEPGEESSVVSLNQEVDIFASHMKIYTTDTDKYKDIMDEPVEMEVFDEDAWASNLMLGAVVALGFAACAVVVVASGGAALGAVALAGAAVGTGLITAGVAYTDKKNKKNRSREEFIGELAIGAGIGMLTALGIVYAGPSLLVAGEQAGVEASYCFGANVLTTSVIPDIVASGGGVLLATDGAYILNELNAMSTGENLAVETVFDGDEENYEDFVMVLEMLNQAFGDLTARGYQRTSAENNSSNITQKNKEESSSETGLDIRNANDESSLNSVDDIIKGVENGNTPLSNNIQKGNYGEMKMDSYFESQGYERISLDKVTDLNTPTHQGIDGVYYNPDGHPPYIIGEAKYGSSKLGITRDGMQMSDTWINGSDRLVNAVGKDMADDIFLEGYGKTLVNIAPDGTIKVTSLD